MREVSTTNSRLEGRVQAAHLIANAWSVHKQQIVQSVFNKKQIKTDQCRGLNSLKSSDTQPKIAFNIIKALPGSVQAHRFHTWHTVARQHGVPRRASLHTHTHVRLWHCGDNKQHHNHL